MSRPSMSWPHDRGFAQRDTAHPSHGQTSQSMGLPPSSSIDPSPYPLAQYEPRSSYSYQDSYGSSSAAPSAYAPPPAPVGGGMTPNQPWDGNNNIPQPLSSYAPQTPTSPEDGRSHSFSRDTTSQDPRSAAYGYGQHSRSLDNPFEYPLGYMPPHPTMSQPPQMMQPSMDPGAESSRIMYSGGRRPGEDAAQYKLLIRQQPFAARSCGFGERDRRVVDPPPIIELLVESPYLTKEEITARLHYSHYVMSCSIYDETGTLDASFMPEEYRHQRRLMGSLVGAPFVGKDENGKEGCFFCFPDLSCRTPGTYRLKFSLVMIDPLRAREVKRFPALVQTMTTPFTVYNAKDFPGMQASTKLTKKLKEQGCIISIKKGNDKARGSRVVEEESSEGELDEPDPSEGKRRRRSSRR